MVIYYTKTVANISTILVSPSNDSRLYMHAQSSMVPVLYGNIYVYVFNFIKKNNKG